MKKLTKKITIILDDESVEKIEKIMAVLKITNYNQILRNLVLNDYSLDSYYEFAINKANEQAKKINKFLQ